MSDAIRKTVRYTGHVQGVGFRWTAQRIAAGYEVSGYVMNMPDGDVELVVEASPEVVKQLLAEIAATMDRYIRNTQIDTRPATGEFLAMGFTIRH
ncbi:MAG: acylphosphatase [Phycisphaeraceae bacterium]